MEGSLVAANWTMDPVALAETIARVSPDLREMWAVHVEENLGSPLPHLFMGEVAQWFVGPSTGSADRVALCHVLEAAMASGDSSVRELIQVSFIENLPTDTPPWITTCFGPALNADLARFRSSWGSGSPKV